MENEWLAEYGLMLTVFDSYSSFAPLRMTTKRKRVILNAAKNLYESPVNDIIIEKPRRYTAVGAAMRRPLTSVRTGVAI